MKRLMHYAAPLAAGLLAACNFAPTYAPPAIATPANYKEYESADWSVAAPGDAWPRGKWWKVFGDPLLDSLEDQVSAANQNLKVAVAQFDEARADAKTAQADFYPTIDAVGSSGRTGLSRNVANPLPNRAYTSNSLGFDFSYEIDVWGRVRNQAKAGVDRAQASAGDLATVDLSLHAELAADYFILRGDDAAQDVLDRTVENYRKALELTEARFQTGYAARPDVSAADAQYEGARTQATENRLKRTNLEHAIAILTGRPPAGFSIAVQKLDATPPEVAPVMPAALLERRPDIAAAERRVAAANADIGVAKVAWYPSFNLNALFGVEAAVPNRFLSAPAEAWSFGPSTVLTLLDGGRRAALNERARASYDEAVAQYRQTVLDAYGEVEDSLASLRLLAQEIVTQQASVKAAADASAQATHLYTGGLENYYDVIVAQNIELAARLTNIDIEMRRMTADVALIKALGGGWNRGDGLELKEGAGTSNAASAS
ncbi:efflux transporter outer membrane subunit [Paraburkholderia solisilvae]|uniref:Outer membrane protein OprM n=1 Tax=Paraburkholderia solisilvae TaxID=624376 RepID=A0A6J5DTH7_9BURK|nr:efflux transporter outer membrane subunit [Paraburkholderia solisilvae]CAB3756332.1 Outer membrane protein OprM [Paraburkholderia solisilvae]